MPLSPKMRDRYQQNQARLDLLKHNASARVSCRGSGFAEKLRQHKVDPAGTKKLNWVIVGDSWPASKWFRNHKRKVSLARQRVEERRGIWPF